jgi:hypothetical protein
VASTQIVARVFGLAVGRDRNLLRVRDPRDVDTYIQCLLDAPVGAQLIIDVVDAFDEFVQFTALPDAIEIDHPLITDGQIRREAGLRRIYSTTGFTLRETKQAGGMRSLDCDLPRDVEAVAVLVKTIMASQFGVTATTRLIFRSV